MASGSCSNTLSHRRHALSLCARLDLCPRLEPSLTCCRKFIVLLPPVPAPFPLPPCPVTQPLLSHVPLTPLQPLPMPLPPTRGPTLWGSPRGTPRALRGPSVGKSSPTALRPLPWPTPLAPDPWPCPLGVGLRGAFREPSAGTPPRLHAHVLARSSVARLPIPCPRRQRHGLPPRPSPC